MSKRRFTNELLDKFLQRDGATLIGEYNKINRDTNIKYTCRCGNEYSKVFRCIVENAGALCKDCGMTHMVETIKKTMMDTYGTSNPMKNEEIKKKAIEL